LNQDREWDIFIPNAILEELNQARMEQRYRDEHFFDDLILFTNETLDEYYKNFTKSVHFLELKRAVKKQEVLYDILRRYSLITQ
jgi:hypothetical protein